MPLPAWVDDRPSSSYLAGPQAQAQQPHQTEVAQRIGKSSLRLHTTHSQTFRYIDRHTSSHPRLAGYAFRYPGHWQHEMGLCQAQAGRDNDVPPFRGRVQGEWGPAPVHERSSRPRTFARGLKSDHNKPHELYLPSSYTTASTPDSLALWRPSDFRRRTITRPGYSTHHQLLLDRPEIQVRTQ